MSPRASVTLTAHVQVRRVGLPISERSLRLGALAAQPRGSSRPGPSSSSLPLSCQSRSVAGPRRALRSWLGTQVARAGGRQVQALRCSSSSVQASGLWHTHCCARHVARRVGLSVQQLGSNMSVNRTRYGMAPWPRGAVCTFSASRPGRHASARRLPLR